MRLHRLRRFAALLLLACLGLLSAESAVAEQCDGDSAGKVVSADGGARISIAPANGQTDAPSRVPQLPTHSVHICHCVHAHGVVPTVNEIAAVVPRPPAFVENGAAMAPSSVWLDPQFRPPVA